MATLRFCYISVLAFCARLVIPGSCLGHFSVQKGHKPLFVFGDSLFDAGNNNYINTPKTAQANFWPYGETYFGYATGRYTDGRQIPDFIAQYSNLPLIPPYLQPGLYNYVYGVNFASGGSGALNETHQGVVIDLQTQLSYFKIVEKQLRHKLGYAQAKTLLSSAVYLFSVGSNDYIAPLQYNISKEFFESYSQEEFIGMVIGNITHVVKEIYKKGGRKFGFLSLGPIGCHPALLVFQQPAGKIGTCREKLTEMAQIHNKAISEALHALEIKLEGFRYSYFDFYTSMSERLNNPTKYGLKEGKKVCCGSGPYRAINNCGGKGPETEYELCDNPSEYVFFDGGHPTERTNQQFSKLMWSGNSNVTWPCNFQELFGSSLLSPTISYGHPGLPKEHAALFIFGDSLFDVENNDYINTSTNFQANFSPYGETFFGYSTGRFSNGRLIPDIIAVYAGLPLIPPYLQPGLDNYTYGVSFASAGAGALAETHQGFKIYKHGGRKFGITGVAPLGCVPSVRATTSGNTGACVEEMNALAVLHNTELSEALLKKKGKLQGFKYSNPDFYTYLNGVFNNPADFGFKEGKTACCGSGPYRGISSCGGKRGVTDYELCDNVTDYVFFDSVHPTERVYEKASEIWWSQTPNVTGSSNNL
ncbi:hypothetical protein ACLB2K_062656 [Fragaria x ananassa]